MAAAIQLDIGGNTARLDRDIQKAVNKVYNINLKTKGDQPLGRITGKVNEFNKSLDASNARVIAFGASAGIIFGVERAFSALVRSTIEVQKSLQDINVILNVSAKQLASFGGELFNIAKNTGQSFDEVARAATEFSRQGLGVAETLKRTNEALILSRLSGLDTAKSVQALTAAVNSFASQAVTATEIVNKFATVDAAFAVSSADLADAISRVGSSASQSGVSLNELIAIVTSAQQTTARGGAVIGNSFKTIFTRLQREKVVDLLESLGISRTDSSGQLKSTIQLLQDLASVYDKLGATQQAAVAEQVGGVFQINILKAALADLGKEYSIYNSALNIAAGATDQAITRNEELNKTYAAQLNALQENAKQLAATAGQRLIGPSFERVVGGANELLGGINESDGKGIGAILGKGILDGLGQLLAGPGLALLGGVLLKLFKDLGKFATGSIKELLGLNTATQQQADLQKSINQILSKNPELLQLMAQGEQGVNLVAQQLLTNLKLQTAELKNQEQLAARVSAQLYTRGVRVAGGIPTAPIGKPGKAAGYIPNFAKNSDFAQEEVLARAFGAKNPKAQMSSGTIGGKKFIKNSEEIEVPNFGKNGDSAVIPTYGRGFLPNFAQKFNIGGRTLSTSQVPSAIKKGTISAEQARQAGYVSSAEKKLAPKQSARPTKNISQLLGFKLPTILTPSSGGGITRIKQDLFPDGTDGQFDFQGFGIKDTSVLKDDFENFVGKNNFIDKFVNDNLLPFATNIASVIKAPPVEPNTFQEIKGAKGFKSSIEGALGGIFDAAITTAIGLAKNDPEKGDFDVRVGSGGQKKKYINELFGANALGGSQSNLGDFKKNIGRDAAKSMIDKTIKEYGTDIQGKYKSTNIEKKAAGYIPNFAAIQDAINREQAAGVPKNQIYLAQENALTAANPMGLGVFNKRDEPTQNTRKMAMRQKGFATGYIPNFAETPETSAANATSAISAVGVELLTLAVLIRSNSSGYKQSLQDLTKANVESLKKTKEAIQTSLRSSNKGGVRQRPGSILFAQEQRQKIDKQIARAEKGNVAQKATAFARGGGLTGIGFAAPILAQTLAQALPQDTKSGRVGAAGLGAVGNIASATATGALFGPIGAAIGFASASLLEIPKFVNSFTTKVPELEKAFAKSSSELTKFGDAGSRLLSTSSELSAALAEVSPSQEKIAKITEQYSAALSELSLEDQGRLKIAQKNGKLEEEYGKILAERTKEFKSQESALKLEKSVEGLGGIVAGTKGSENEKLIKSTFGNLLTGGRQDKDALEAVQKSAQVALPQLSNLFIKASQESMSQSGAWFDEGGGIANITKELEVVLNNAIPDSESKAEEINAILSAASQGPESLINVIEDLINKYGEEAASISNILKIIDQKKIADQKEAEAKKQASQATEKIISNLETNIRVAQRAADSQRALAQAQAQFVRNTAFADTFSRPRETVGAIVGESAPLAQSLQLREEVAGIGLRQAEGIEKVTSTFVNDINESIRGAFSGAVAEVRGQATTEGSSGDIAKLNDQLSGLSFQLGGGGTSEGAFREVQNILNDALKNGGELKTDAILTNIEQVLTKAGASNAAIAKLTPQIIQQVREAGDKSNNEIKLLKDSSLKEFKTLAKEQTQKILIARITQAQKFAGGIDEFLNPKKPGESLFDNVVKSTKGLDEFQGQGVDYRFDYRPGSNEFKYGYGAAERARQEMAPEYGRASLDLIGQLQSFTGYTPDAEGKAYQAGVSGLEEFLKRQVNELQTIAKSSETPTIVKDEINAALSEIDKLGGIRNIAELQVAQRTGALTEEGYRKITGRFQDSNLETLRTRAQAAGGPDLVAAIDEMAKNALISQDPTVGAINESNSILAGILDAVGGQTQEQKISEAVRLAEKEAGIVSPIASQNINTRDRLLQSTTSLPLTKASEKLAIPEQNANFISSVESNSTALINLTNVIQSLQNSIQNQITTQQTANATQGVTTQQNLAQQTPQAQQAAQSNTTVGPFNVVVNQTQSDLTTQINQAMEQLKAEILRLVDVKVPPTTTPNRVQ